MVADREISKFYNILEDDKFHGENKADKVEKMGVKKVGKQSFTKRLSFEQNLKEVME